MERLSDISYAGQRFIEEPVYTRISRARGISLAIHDMYRHTVDVVRPRKVAEAVAGAFGSARPFPRVTVPTAGPPVKEAILEFSHYARTPLEWVKPDARGQLVPMGKSDWKQIGDWSAPMNSNPP